MAGIYASPEGARAVERRYRELLKRRPGGWMALDYATRWPERVERLALMCPSGTGHLLPAHTREIMDFLENAHA
ncbi:hypothetical protein [Nonomuraea sp. NPDC005650]|uniref:hypothetical protein n=1 Tax=Nonomuraea sp. NPDC005650 TaxID=3157045 RepID=UPI0033BECF92